MINNIILQLVCLIQFLIFKKYCSDCNDLWKKYRMGGIAKNKSVPEILWKIDAIAVLGNLILNKFFPFKNLLKIKFMKQKDRRKSSK